MENNSFTKWLLKELADRDWSQAYLARKARLNKGSISNVLTGQRQPGKDLCKSLARAFGYPPEFVFRIAGLLPPIPKDQLEFERFKARLELLTPENRERILRLIEMEYQLQLEEEERLAARLSPGSEF